MLNKLDHKKELILSLSFFIIVYLLYNNPYSFSNQFGFVSSVFNIQLTGLPFTIVRDIFLLIPFVFFAFILILVIHHFANLIKDHRFRLYLKALSIIILVGGSIILGFQLLNPNYKSPPSTIPEMSSSDTTTFSTSSSAVSNTTSANTSTLSININYSIPTVTLAIPSFIYQILDLLFIFIILFIALFIIRSFRENRLTGLKKTDKKSRMYKTVNISDFNRKTIIKEYLKLSKELELKGISQDFSLTPMEFEIEARSNLNINQLKKITFYYELARFSEEPISEEEFLEFQSLINEIYNALSEPSEEVV